MPWYEECSLKKGSDSLELLNSGLWRSSNHNLPQTPMTPKAYFGAASQASLLGDSGINPSHFCFSDVLAKPKFGDSQQAKQAYGGPVLLGIKLKI